MIISERSKKREYIESVLIVIIFAFLSVGIVLALFGGEQKKYQEIYDKDLFYLVIGIIFAVAGVILKIVGTAIRGNKDLEKRYGFFFAKVWDLNFSPLYRFKWFRKYGTFSNIFWFSINLFSIYGLYGAYTKHFWVATRQTFLEGFNKFSSILANVEPDIFSETMLIMFFIGGISEGLLWWYKANNNKSDEWFINFSWISTIPMVITAIIVHLLKYIYIQGAIPAVAFFWTVSGFLYWIFGGWVVPYIYHFFNNLFETLIDLGYTLKEVVIFTFIFLVLFNFVFIVVKLTIRRIKHG